MTVADVLEGMFQPQARALVSDRAMLNDSAVRVPYLILFAQKSSVPLPEKFWAGGQAEATPLSAVVRGHGRTWEQDRGRCVGM